MGRPRKTQVEVDAVEEVQKVKERSRLADLVSQRTYRIRLIEPMLGTVPKDPAVYKAYIETKKKEHQAKYGNITAEALAEDEAANVMKTEEKGWTGFMKDDVGGLFIYDYTIRGFLKASADALAEMLTAQRKIGGVVTVDRLKAAKSKIDKFVFVVPRRIYLGKMEPDGVVERPLRAQTMQGPRVTVARSDFVKEGIELEFTIKLIPNKDITWDMLDFLMEYGEFSGLGQFRNGSYGRFEVVFVS